MFQVDFSNLAIRSKYSCGLSDFREYIYRLIILELWLYTGREEFHLIAVFFSVQTFVVVNLNHNVIQELDFSAWLYEIRWTC